MILAIEVKIMASKRKNEDILKSLKTECSISTMFKDPESVIQDRLKCCKHLRIEEISSDEDVCELSIERNDELNISHLIGIYQEASFFDGYKIDNYIGLRYKEEISGKSLDEKVLFKASLETKQGYTQVELPFITDDVKKELRKRLSKYFSPEDSAQIDCRIPFFISGLGEKDSPSFNKPYFFAKGRADVVKDGIVYEIKFAPEAASLPGADTIYSLQLACYMVALGLEKGRLINTFDNRAYEVEILNKTEFLKHVAHTITKQEFKNKILVGEKAKRKITEFEIESMPEVFQKNFKKMSQQEILNLLSNVQPLKKSIGKVIQPLAFTFHVGSHYDEYAEQYKKGTKTRMWTHDTIYEGFAYTFYKEARNLEEARRLVYAFNFISDLRSQSSSSYSPEFPKITISREPKGEKQHLHYSFEFVEDDENAS